MKHLRLVILMELKYLEMLDLHDYWLYSINVPLFGFTLFKDFHFLVLFKAVFHCLCSRRSKPLAFLHASWLLVICRMTLNEQTASIVYTVL